MSRSLALITTCICVVIGFKVICRYDVPAAEYRKASNTTHVASTEQLSSLAVITDSKIDSFLDRKDITPK